ncbi:MAG: fibronectin type III domain-containing protein, partial [Saprospiraceae bacterium]|nr:fibronectin type III domain-containing protein [Saprospiraceae bacterium]
MVQALEVVVIEAFQYFQKFAIQHNRSKKIRALWKMKKKCGKNLRAKDRPLLADFDPKQRLIFLMMKKRIVLQLLTLLLCCGALPVAFSNNLTDPPSDESQSCAVPPPTNVHATAVTPTTISLAWTDATPATQNYYKVQGVNLNTGLPIPDVYTSGENTTITGLTPNNCYSFKVSASVCPTGPYGKPSLPGEGCTGYIVIDIIAEYNAPSGNGESYPINTDPIPLCMPRSSTNGHSAPFDNPVVCQLTYNGLNLRFGLALTPGNENNVPIDFIPINGSGPDPNFNFSYRDPEHRIVWLQYGPSPVLEVKYISVVDPGGLAFAHLEAKILNTA